MKAGCIFLLVVLGLSSDLGRAAEEAQEGVALDEVSAHVLTNLLEKNLNMVTVLRVIRKASCTVDVRLSSGGSTSSGTLSYSWEDADDDGALTEAEVEIETEYVSSRAMGATMRSIHKTLRTMAVLNPGSLLALPSAKTEKVSGGYQTTLKHEEGASIQLTISDDFRVTRFRVKGAEGNESTTTFTHEKAQDKWLVKGAVVTSKEPGAGLSTREQWTFSYLWHDGIPLLSKMTGSINAATPAGAVQMREEISARGWKLVKREQPLELPVVAVAKKEETPEVTTAGREAAPAGGGVSKMERNTETLKVGMDVYSRLAARYYNLNTHTDVVAFEASYALERNGQPIGTMDVSWDSRRKSYDIGRPPFPYHVEKINVTFNPRDGGPTPRGGAREAAEKMQREIELFGKAIFSIVAERTFPFAGMVYGIKQPLGHFIDVTEFYRISNPFIRLTTTFVTEDLCQVSNIASMNDGETRRTVFKGEEVEGKHYVSKVTFSIQPKGSGISQSQEYTFTYFHTEGVVFLKRALLEIKEGEQRASLKAEFRNVTFERRKEGPEKEPQKPETPEEKEPAGTETGRGAEPTKETTEPENDALGTDEAIRLTQQVKVPRTTEAAKLANEVIDSLEKSYYSLLYSTDEPGLEADFSFSATGDAIGDGTVQAIWNRRDPRRITTAVKVNEETGILDMRRSVRVLMDDTFRTLALGPLRGVHGSGVYAAKCGNRFLLDACEWAAKSNPTLKTQFFLVSADLDEVRMITFPPNGGVEEMILRGESAGEKKYVSSCTLSVRAPGARDVKMEYSWSYTRRYGEPFVREVEMTRTEGVSLISEWTVTVQKVTFGDFAVPSGR